MLLFCLFFCWCSCSAGDSRAWTVSHLRGEKIFIDNFTRSPNLISFDTWWNNEVLICRCRSSFSELCCLFCCPPCPSRIAAKLAFLPPEPTYMLVANEEVKSKFQLQLNEKAEWPYSERDKDTIESFYTRTSRGNRIACIFVKCCTNARYTLLFSHGNAVDLGQMSSFYLGLGSRINCNIFRWVDAGTISELNKLVGILVLRFISHFKEFHKASNLSTIAYD